MANTLSPAQPGAATNGQQDIGFAIGIVGILTVLFLPLPALLIDAGLALSIALSVLILMVSLWIKRPLEFSSFPTVLLIATMLRLALNIATTRLILSNGADGHMAAGYVIAGFSNFVMGGDFVIGTIVFVILITVNFLVITKGASRIAEVGARFTLDAIPGKQMAIDADLAAGQIDEQEAKLRRRELEEESAFFGSMDGASKFVRGDAVAGLIITGVNAFGGILIGILRHDMSIASAADVFVKLSVGDGLVTQIPALIVSLAAGLLVSKGGTRGSADQAILTQLGKYPRAIWIATSVLVVLAAAPGLPFLPFAILAVILGGIASAIPKREAKALAIVAAEAQARSDAEAETAKASIKEQLKSNDLELVLGKQLSASMLPAREELANRVAKMRRKFAQQFGFVIPDIKLTDDLGVAPKSYTIRLHGTAVATEQMRIGEQLVIVGDGPMPDVPGDEAREPAFGMKALWVPEQFAAKLKMDGFTPIDTMSVMLTHVGEVIRGNLGAMLSYRDMRSLIERLDPEYKRLVEELIPAHLTYSGLQSVLKMLLAERVSIRNLHLILEAIAEVAPHMRRVEQLVEHVRARMGSQICGDLLDDGVLKVVRLGPRWDMAFHQSLKRDGKGEVVEFDIDPRQIEQFGIDVTRLASSLSDQGHRIVLVTAPEARPYVRMVTERVYPTLAVISHAEIARGIQIKALGSLS